MTAVNLATMPCCTLRNLPQIYQIDFFLYGILDKIKLIVSSSQCGRGNLFNLIWNSLFCLICG